jgi:hypothetical protein
MRRKTTHVHIQNAPAILTREFSLEEHVSLLLDDLRSVLREQAPDHVLKTQPSVRLSGEDQGLPEMEIAESGRRRPAARRGYGGYGEVMIAAGLGVAAASLASLLAMGTGASFSLRARSGRVVLYFHLIYNSRCFQRLRGFRWLYNVVFSAHPYFSILQHFMASMWPR